MVCTPGCYNVINTMAVVNSTEYAIGVPIDTPAMILTFHDKSAEPAKTFPISSEFLQDSVEIGDDDGDHNNNVIDIYEVTEKGLGEDEFDSLVGHITDELNAAAQEERDCGFVSLHEDDNNLYLHNTPVVLTIEGNLQLENDNDAIDEVDEDEERDEENVESRHQENIGTAEDDSNNITNDEEDDDEDDDDDSESIAVAAAAQLAEEVLQDATDAELVGTFLFKKRCYHLVRITEVAFMNWSEFL